MKRFAEFFSYACGSVGIVFSAQDIESIFSIVLICLSIASIGLTTLLKVIELVKKAKEDDGRISVDEATGIIDTIKGGVDEMVAKGKGDKTSEDDHGTNQ